MSLHVIVLLYPHGAQERGCTACVRSVLLSGWSGCRAVSAAVRPLCAVGLSGSCQAVTLRPDSDGTPLMSGSAVRLSDTCCQAVREIAVNAVRLSGTVRRALSGVCCHVSGCQTIIEQRGRGHKPPVGTRGAWPWTPSPSPSRDVQQQTTRGRPATATPKLSGSESAHRAEEDRPSDGFAVAPLSAAAASRFRCRCAGSYRKQRMRPSLVA